MELAAAKRERDFYLNKVDQSKALSKIGERLMKVVPPCISNIHTVLEDETCRADDSCFSNAEAED